MVEGEERSRAEEWNKNTVKEWQRWTVTKNGIAFKKPASRKVQQG